jgi:hypothetical protein
MNMIFDLNPSPNFLMIRVNGRLTFDPEKDTHLRCQKLLVRAGELFIGSEEEPYEK